jgi:hypothetical protein
MTTDRPATVLATRRACGGLDAVNEASKTGDTEAIREGFEDYYAAAHESDDAEFTSLVSALRDADGDADFALALTDVVAYCEELAE